MAVYGPSVTKLDSIVSLGGGMEAEAGSSMVVLHGASLYFLITAWWLEMRMWVWSLIPLG